MKTVLITGANRGIGLELVRQYEADGWRVIACCRTLKNQVDRENRLIYIKLDVTDTGQIKNLVGKLKKEPIDILINNAGVSGPSNEEMDLFDPLAWLKTLHVNAVAPYTIAQALANQVESSHLKIIVNISSIYGSMGLNTHSSNYCIYRASKAALNAVTKCLANAFQERGITVISLHPGSVKTDMNPDGKISPCESVQGIRKVLHSLSLKDSGSFVNYSGEPLAW